MFFSLLIWIIFWIADNEMMKTVRGLQVRQCRTFKKINEHGNIQMSSLETFPSRKKSIRVISLDVTGTILIHKYPIMETYAEAAIWARLPNPPNSLELKPAFKKAYFESSRDFPCFGRGRMSSREWWYRTVKAVMTNCGRNYEEEEFNRYFRRVYQHFGSLEGYEVLPDALEFLKWATDGNDPACLKLQLGITSNTPTRTVETVVPMLGLHNHFKWFVCCEDVGEEKPSEKIFDNAFEKARYWMPDLRRDEVLHIGDSLAADYCGARAAGLRALYLDRSGNFRVNTYQDWLQGPAYIGKSDADISRHTVKNFGEVRAKLEEEFF